MPHVPPRPPRRRLAAVLAGLVLLTGTVLGASAVPAGAAAVPAGTAAPRADGTLPAPHNPARDTVAAMQPSWNVGNTMDAYPAETSWGNPLITKRLFDTVKAQGFHSVRIPVTWSSHQSATAPFTIDPLWLARVKQVVDWAVEDGLYVDLNVHHDSWQWIEHLPTDHDNVLARYDATWTQIAAEFKNEPRKLLFEDVNEPQFKDASGAAVPDAQAIQCLDELDGAFFDIVRRSGGNNGSRLLLLFPTANTQAGFDAQAAEIASLHDPNLVATVHDYGFWPFTVNIAGYDSFDPRVKQDMLDLYSEIYSTFVAKGVPVYMGEYIRSGWKTRSGTADSDQLFVPETGPITARTIGLDLNGLTFKGLSAGDWKLVKGRDYAVDGDQLTLTAAAVARLAGSRTEGVDSTLTVRFSRGVPWSIHVTTNGPVTQADATGTTADGLVIPTRFHGDVLAEMAAEYADGSGAGPASWTTYQEYGVAFVPDAAGDTITMTPAFLDAVKDGVPVKLTFSYWSGATTTYTVTKSGATVTGSVL